MSYIDFENSSLEEKAKFVWENAVYVESVEYYRAKVNLYSIGKEFIEVFYSPVTNDIIRIVFADEHSLKKYLSKIVLAF
jgi:hypothetical protein